MVATVFICYYCFRNVFSLITISNDRASNNVWISTNAERRPIKNRTDELFHASCNKIIQNVQPYIFYIFLMLITTKNRVSSIHTITDQVPQFCSCKVKENGKNMISLLMFAVIIKNNFISLPRVYELLIESPVSRLPSRVPGRVRVN